MVEGDYVAWIDAGDVWYPSKLERQFEHLSRLRFAGRRHRPGLGHLQLRLAVERPAGRATPPRRWAASQLQGADARRQAARLSLDAARHRRELPRGRALRRATCRGCRTSTSSSASCAPAACSPRPRGARRSAATTSPTSAATPPRSARCNRLILEKYRPSFAGLRPRLPHHHPLQRRDAVGALRQEQRRRPHPRLLPRARLRGRPQAHARARPALAAPRAGTEMRLHLLAGCRDLLLPLPLAPELAAGLIGPQVRVATAFWLAPPRRARLPRLPARRPGDRRLEVFALALQRELRRPLRAAGGAAGAARRGAPAAAAGAGSRSELLRGSGPTRSLRGWCCTRSPCPRPPTRRAPGRRPPGCSPPRRRRGSRRWRPPAPRAACPRRALETRLTAAAPELPAFAALWRNAVAGRLAAQRAAAARRGGARARPRAGAAPRSAGCSPPGAAPASRPPSG